MHRNIDITSPKPQASSHTRWWLACATLWLGGIVLGFACSWGVTRWMRSLLFEVQAADPATFIAVALLFCAVAAAACYVPARRATRVDPAISLRYE